MKVRIPIYLITAAAACAPLFGAPAKPAPAPAPVQQAPAANEGEQLDEEEVSEGIPDYIGPQRDEDRKAGEVPAMFRDDAMLDESHSNQELGINVYTAPSISKIFDQMDNLPPVPEEYVLRDREETLSTNPGKLALSMGYLLADGFIAVRSGHMNDIKPIALDLTRYGNAMGVGEKMNAHSASLLEHAEKGQLEEFKRILASTQSDVNAELAALRDPDLSHLIALGGWIRALDAACAAIEAKFDAKQAAIVFYPDAPAYFNEILEGVNPKTAEKLHVADMRALLVEMAGQMALEKGQAPTMEKVQALHKTAAALSTLAIGQGHEH